MNKLFGLLSILCCSLAVTAQKPVPVKPRILISTDIGGTDPDDNQSMRSAIPGFPEQSGRLVVNNQWPGKAGKTDYPLGPHWYTGRSDPRLYDGNIQGGITVKKWRHEVLQDWAKRWAWLQ